jgi:hypothetical protein
MFLSHHFEPPFHIIAVGGAESVTLAVYSHFSDPSGLHDALVSASDEMPKCRVASIGNFAIDTSFAFHFFSIF